MNESFYMHSRYQEFLDFIKGLETDARITPNSLNLAFDVWLNKKSNQSTIVVEQSKHISKLVDDLNRLHRERDSFQQQARVLAEEVDRLQSDLKRARDALASVAFAAIKKN